jgi:hypothetical protein
MRPITVENQKTTSNLSYKIRWNGKNRLILLYCPFISGHGGGAHTPAPPEAVEQVQYIDGKELLSKKIKLSNIQYTASTICWFLCHTTKKFPEKELCGSVPLSTFMCL